MNKILLIFDAANFSIQTFEFVKHQNEQKPCLFKAYFLTPDEHASIFNYSLSPGQQECSLTRTQDEESIVKSSNYFKLLCEKNNIEYLISNERGAKALTSLILETRFADLLVIDMESFYVNTTNNTYATCMGNILHSSECPVYLLPDDFDFPLKIIFSYDGSASSMFAIRQFCYLFPEMHSRVATLFYATGREEDLPNKELLESFIKRYFSILNIAKVNDNPSVYQSNWVSENESALLVAGAFGRSGLSVILKASFLSKVLKQHKIPLFIANPPKNAS